MQPAAFGKTLYLWEKEWANANTSDTLTHWITVLNGFIRERSTDMPSESGGE